MNELIDKKIGNEIEGELISDLFNGYVFKIQGGFDKDGFSMKNGVLTQGKRRIMLHKGSKNFHFRNGYHRTGVVKRKLVRGCIISPDIRVLHLKIVKIGEKPIPGKIPLYTLLNPPINILIYNNFNLLLGITESGCELPKRLGPKRATNILKEYGLLDIYNKKKQNSEERKTLRYMITKFAGKREVKSSKSGKVWIKRPKIQRLITPTRLRRKRVIKVIIPFNIQKIKDDRRKENEDLVKKYREDIHRYEKDLKKAKHSAKKDKKKK